MWTRRQFLSRGALGVLGASGTALAFQGDGRREAMPDGSQSRGMATDACDKAVTRGLDYLASKQGASGSWGTNGYPANVAVTSVAAIAMMASGSMPGRGRYGENIKRALDFVLKQGERGAGRAGPLGLDHPAGFLHNPDQHGQQGPMYSHGFGTLFLGEVSGMVGDNALSERVHTGLGKAVKVIIGAQNVDGGWRYNPRPIDADISVTVCQMMALRSAKNAGAFVPASAAKRCVDYVKRCWTNDGSFVYQANNRAFGFPGGGGGFARTAAGVAALYSAGTYEGKEISTGLDYLVRSRPQRAAGQADMHYFYGHYYAIQAMWTKGGDYWADWYPRIRDELVHFQTHDGSWADLLCTHYGTAMACIILQVPNNYLPILQK
jgi:Prenyltransferase and squalene oxidase repeat